MGQGTERAGTLRGKRDRWAGPGSPAQVRPAARRGSVSLQAPCLLRSGPQDGAQIQVLEAVLIAVIMLGAIGFVLTFTLPTSETEPTREGLDTRATDALAVLNEFPVDDTRYGGNMLSYAVARALEGDTSTLAERLEALLPPATKFNVYLSNGQESYEIYESGEPRGETVTATHVLEPKWQYSFVDRDTSFVKDPQTLGVYALPVFNSNPIDDGGVLIEVAVDFEQGGHKWTKQSYYSTVQGASDRWGNVVSSNVFGSTATGEPQPYYDRTLPTGQYDSAQTTVYVTVSQDEPTGKIPSGTNLVLRIPQGIAASGGTVLGEFTTLAPTTVDPTTGGTLTIRLDRDVAAGDALTVAFEAEDSTDREYQYFVIDATLSGEVHGKAEIVLQDRVLPTFTGGDYIDVYASVPKPMGLTTASVWTVVVADAPMQPDTVAPVMVERVRISQLDGIKLFDSVVTKDAPSGALTVAPDGASLVWEPATPYEFSGTDAKKAFALVFEPTPAGTTTKDGAQDYLTVPVTVNDGADTYVQHLTRRVEPGLFYGQIPGKSGPRAGYEAASGSSYPVVAGPVHRGEVLLGDWTYDVGTVPFKDFLSTATIDVNPRQAPVGKRATIEINVENLLSHLMLRGFSVKTTTSIFPPWSIATHDPLFSKESEETTATNKDVTQVVLVDVTGDDVLDLIVGTNEGKLVGFDVGNDGAVISGLTRTWQGQAVRDVDTMIVDGRNYFVVGLAKDASTGASLDTLRVLDESFDDRPVPYSFDLGIYDVGSVSAGFDLDGDGNEDYLAGDDRGTTSAFDGARLDEDDETQTPISAGWPHEADQRAALTAFGTTGPVPEATAIVTNGVEASVGVWRTADYTQSTNEGELTGAALDLVKRASVSTNGDGLMGYTAEGERVWSFPGGGFTAIDAQDLNADGTTDMVAGTWDGYVYAVNGRQAALPWQGLTITTGDKITDADFVDVDSGWTVDPQGLAMRTRDGMTTRDYANGIPVQTVGANGLDLVDRNLGFLVGAAATIWKTPDGGGTVDPFTAWTIKNPTNPLLPQLYPGGTWGTSNFLDVDFYNANQGIIVGTACTGTHCLGRSKPIYTLDGGTTWRPGTIETSGVLSLERVTYVDSLTAFAVGGHRVYRTLDKGVSWTAVSPTTSLLDVWHGIDCLDALKCWVVGDAGKMYKTTNGGTSWSALTTGVTADLLDVDFLDATHGIAVGEQTTVLVTKDAGVNWALTPGGGPLIADWTTVNYVAEDIAYIFGGNATTRAFGTTAAYESSAYATTKTIIDSDTDAYHSNTVITTAKIEPIAFNNEFTSIEYSVSTDDGAHFTKIVPLDPDDLDLLGGRTYPFQPVAGGGGKVKMKFDMGVDLDYVFNSPVLRSLDITYNSTFKCKVAVGLCMGLTYVTGCDGLTAICTETRKIEVPIAGGTLIDAGQTTAEYVSIGGAYELRLPRVPKFWTTHLKGAVNGLDASRDVDMDGVNDVVVAVGAVNTALGTPSSTRIDKVYLLDGSTGLTLASYEPTPYGLTAEPWRVRYADIGQVDENGAVLRARDGVPEIVLAVADSTKTSSDGQIVVLDDSLVEIDRWEISGRPDVLVVEDVDRNDGIALDDFIVGTAMNTEGAPGAAIVYSGVDALEAGEWTALVAVSPELGGRYVVNWDVDRNAPYGPYIVQTEVTWTDTKTGAIQRLYLDNYFTVTPPGAQMPLSPVYTVHLVAWFEDWDVARS